jgi:osmotically-inducible protein OsmY
MMKNSYKFLSLTPAFSMAHIGKKSVILTGLVTILLYQTACTPAGVVLGTGASLGVASMKEGGISAAADDVRIKALISEAWLKYDLKTFAKLTLTVNQGRVLITGVVQNPDDRVEAVRLAWQVSGVVQVINEIRVADSDGVPGFVRDQWISARLRTAIMLDKEIYSINYSIETVQGTIYLMGVAQSQAELDLVIEKARTIPNVSDVVSYVKMAGQAIPAQAQSGQSNFTMAPVSDNASSQWGTSSATGAPHDMGGAPMGTAARPAVVDAEALPPW